MSRALSLHVPHSHRTPGIKTWTKLHKPFQFAYAYAYSYSLVLIFMGVYSEKSLKKSLFISTVGLFTPLHCSNNQLYNVTTRPYLPLYRFTRVLHASRPQPICTSTIRYQPKTTVQHTFFFSWEEGAHLYQSCQCYPYTGDIPRAER